MQVSETYSSIMLLFTDLHPKVDADTGRTVLSQSYFTLSYIYIYILINSAARSTYEINDCREEQDILSVAGYLNLIKKVLRVQPGGLLHGGHPCSNMVWMSRSVHCRSEQMPWGDVGQASRQAVMGYYVLMVKSCIACYCPNYIHAIL